MARAYGSITIVDIGDLGQLSVVPESNLPTMVLYDPDTGTYVPNWGDTNLILTPIVYYGGKQISLSNTKLKVTWKVKENTGSSTNITSGVDKGVLTIATNPFVPGRTTLLTYIVTVEFTESATETTLTASGQITYGLIQNASRAKSISITGESAFLYQADGKPTFSTIKLSATAKNTTISKWQYKDSKEEFIDFPESVGKSTITILEDSNYFNKDVGVFRVVAAEEGLYDDHTIVKIRDGANGTSTVSAVLSNEDQMIPCGADGTPIENAFGDAVTTLTVYEGSTNVTNKWSIEILKSGVDGTASEDNSTFQVTSISADTGFVQFTCTRSGFDTIVKKFSLIKMKTGADGVSPTIYGLSTDAVAINATIDASGAITAYNPTKININAYSQQGNSEKKPYLGRFQIFVDDGDAPIYTSGVDESEKSWTISNVKKKIIVKLFAKGAVTNLLDSQTIVIITDGQKGETGDAGKPGTDSLSFILGNYSEVIPCANNGSTIQPIDINIPFSVYQGIKKVACTIEVSSALPAGVTHSSTPGTVSTDGNLIIQIPKGNTLDGKDTGEIKLTITATGLQKTMIKSFTWTKNKQAANGQNSVLFQIFSPRGNIISNNKNNILLEASLLDGATKVTASSYQWSKFNGLTYVNIEGANTFEYTVLASDVDGYSSYKCTAVYKGQTYIAYLSVYDRTDPLQATIISTLGDKIVNSKGQGLVYAKVYQSGEEIDKMKTLDHGTSYPSSPNQAQYFYLLDSTKQTATLKQYLGNSWKDVPVDQETYTWYLRGETGEPQVKHGKAIYIDADVIKNKMTFDVEVTI